MQQAEQEERNAQIMREVDAVRELEQRVTEVTRELEQVCGLQLLVYAAFSY